MTRYSDDEISKIRETIISNMRRRNFGSAVEIPQPEVFEDIGLEIPTTPITLPELQALIKQVGSLSGNISTQRMNEIWFPFFSASINTANFGLSATPIPRYGMESMMISPITGKNIQVVGGTSGTLKSTFRNMAQDWHNGIIEWDPVLGVILPRFLPKSNAVHIDPDEARLIIPEYRAFLKHGLPGGASFVHQEARSAALEFFETATGGTGNFVENIVYDTSGQFNSGHDRNIREAIKRGYRVDAIYFFADMEKIYPRLQKREIETGRGVPAGIPETIQSNLRSLIPQLFKPANRGGIFNSLTIVDTSDADNPVLIYVGEYDQNGSLNTMINIDNNFIDTSGW